MTVKTRLPLSNLGELAGVHDLSEDELGLSFYVDREKLEEVMSYVSQQGILMIESSPPTLEDLFMEHYEGEGND